MDLRSAFRQGMADEMQQGQGFRKFTGQSGNDRMRSLVTGGRGMSPLYAQAEQFLYQNRPEQVMDAQMAASADPYGYGNYGGQFVEGVPGQQMQGLQGIQRPEGMPQTLDLQFAPGQAPEAMQDIVRQSLQQRGQNQPPMLQGPRPMPAPMQSEPAAQQRVLNQDQRRQYNQLRREQGQGAAKDFRESVKAGESGLGNRRPNFRKR
jgi:hypothetical protein